MAFYLSVFFKALVFFIRATLTRYLIFNIFNVNIIIIIDGTICHINRIRGPIHLVIIVIANPGQRWKVIMRQIQ